MKLALKRLIDIVGALILLVLTFPVSVLTAFAVSIKLGPPTIFSQKRVGLHNRIFTLYKFRSMSSLEEALPSKSSDEHRLSGFGKALRSTSLDELPELWNIIKGDMSLIGPRPLLPEYLPYYSDNEKKRHLMRPGLTGLAQVKGRNALSWEERLALDVFYVEHWSLRLDLQIALATFKTVFLRQGIAAKGAATMPRFDTYVLEKQKSSSDRKQQL